MSKRGILLLSIIMMGLLTLGTGNDLGCGKFAPGVVYAEEINLRGAIEIALKNNLELLAFQKRLEEAKGEITRASFLLPSNPTVGAEMNNRYSTRENTGDTDYIITLSQELQVAGQRGKKISVAEKNLQKVSAEIEALEWDIITRVKQNFYEVLALKMVLEARQAIELLYGGLKDALQSKFDEGAATILELNTAHIQYSQARKESLSASARYISSLLGLKFLLAMPEDYPIKLIGELEYQPIMADLSNLINWALETRPDLKALGQEVERAELEIDLLKSQRIPNPQVSGFLAREEGEQRIVGGGISIPLPIIDRKQADLQKASAVRGAAELNFTNRLLQVRKEVQSAYEIFTASQKGLEAYKDIAPEIEESLRLNEVTYREGKIGFLEFVLVQNNLIEAKISYLGTLLEYYQAIAELEKAATKKLVE